MRVLLLLLMIVMLNACGGGVGEVNETSETEQFDAVFNFKSTTNSGQKIYAVSVNNGSTRYLRGSSFSSADNDYINPALLLKVGERYRFVVSNPGAHPLEFVSSENVGAILSQAYGNDGEYENDGLIAWEERDDGSVVFTFTQDLADIIIGGGSLKYRCSQHAEMIGRIELMS